jgi:membrane protease YdiL (CAAX protease family)
MPRATRKASAPRGILGVVIYAALYLASDIILSVIAYLLYFGGVISQNSFTFLADAFSLLSLSIAVFAYFMIYKRASIAKALKDLGFARKNLLRNVGIGFLILFIIIMLELVVALVGQISNVQINTNVQNEFIGAPLWFYIFAAIIEPVNEEIFFRGFLINAINNGVNRMGSLIRYLALFVFAVFNSVLVYVILSSFIQLPVIAEVAISAIAGFAIEYLIARRASNAKTSAITGIANGAVIFGLGHYSYYSTFGIEVIAALMFGLIAGYVFKKTNSIYPGIIAHVIINTVAVIGLLGGI